MANATFAVPHFLGGEISQFAQGRFDRPDYKVSLNVCLNAFPAEIGAWTRRPGSAHAGHTRVGAAGRVIEFDFEDANPVTLEYTAGWLRFRNGTTLITTNDAQTVVSVSTANPAVVQVSSAVTWATGDTAIFPGTSTPLLENRQFTMTRIDSTHFSLADALSGATLDGSTLGALASGATVAHVHELATTYVGQDVANLRAVQAETTMVTLCSAVPPQILTVATEPATGIQAQFSLAAAVFNDGPYLDPVTNGAQLTPNTTSGIVALTLSFPTYVSTKAYKLGDLVTSSSVNYQSLIDQNVGNTPASVPAAWLAVGANVAVNGGQGFLASDVGRLIRLLNEPTAWASGSTYTSGQVVSYNPTGVAGAATYWSSLVGSNIGNVPGTDITHWQLLTNQAAAIWTWGKITSLSNTISGATGTVIGNMSSGGGNSAAFDSVLQKNRPNSAQLGVSGGAVPPITTLSADAYVGKNFTGSAKQITGVTVYPSSDSGFGIGTYNQNSDRGPVSQQFSPLTFTLNLRGKASAPSSASDGTVLGTTRFNNTTSPVTVSSNDTATAWNYVWVELLAQFSVDTDGAINYSFSSAISQVVLLAPVGTGITNGVNVEILGPSLLYSNTIQTWRLGAYSSTTGYPSCGCYAGGRLFLGGAISNRWDACYANGIVGATVNFAPTDQYGTVTAAHAINYTLNSDAVNPMFWMVPVQEGVIMGTQGGEWLIFPPGNGALAPNNVDSRRLTRIGSSFVEPRRTEHTTVFVKRYARKLMEYFADVYSGRYSAPNLADKAQHITSAGIAELAYTDAVTPILWGRDTANALFGLTYKRDSLASAQGPTYAAWHRHALGSGRVVESICSGPSTGGSLDALTMVTNDAATNLRHVEVLTDTVDELTPLQQGWFLDDAINPSSFSTTSVASNGAPYGGATFNGLWHLNGKTVQVFAAGLDCGDTAIDGAAFIDFLVTNGSIFVPFGDSVSAGSGRGLFTSAYLASIPLSEVVVGFTYNSDGQLVRRNDPAETGARNGPAMGKKRRNHRYAMQLVNARGISVGCQFTDMYPADFRQADDVTAIDTLDAFTGIHQDALECDYDYDGMLCWRVSRPMPATVVALAVNTQTQDQ